ncbi:SRPBCC family protein [Quadrisphaera setariae]|uniref:SRPBCC family protein n=1 Tax=Quadrisphaera setariae TaxID=2593304 RepID=A0A5C8ZH79_9ACTN|nr:SRPBCC family protein [Quadrisphaera setariae]TXR56499.1 SRPBCC family protein [Quadrisphaera setariae]
MSTRHHWVPVRSELVWEVLSDPWNYPVFVVGTAHLRAVEGDWPVVGAVLHHSFGAWPLMQRGTSTLDGVDPGKRLELTAKGWPLGEARVVISLLGRGDGTIVTIEEDAVSGPGSWVPRPLRALVIGLRNKELLARLEDLAVGRLDASPAAERAAGEASETAG